MAEWTLTAQNRCSQKVERKLRAIADNLRAKGMTLVEAVVMKAKRGYKVEYSFYDPKIGTRGYFTTRVV